jgi:hypothetical protein
MSFFITKKSKEKSNHRTKKNRLPGACWKISEENLFFFLFLPQISTQKKKNELKISLAHVEYKKQYFLN